MSKGENRKRHLHHVLTLPANRKPGGNKKENWNNGTHKQYPHHLNDAIDALKGFRIRHQPEWVECDERREAQSRPNAVLLYMHATEVIGNVNNSGRGD